MFSFIQEILVSHPINNLERYDMNRLTTIALAGVIVGVLTVGANAQITKGKTRAATTKQLMGGLVKPNCAGIGEGLKAAPTDDKGWADLATKAALLNEASYLLMDDGRCPDKAWADAAKELREGSVAVLAKVEAKDFDGAKEAFKGVTGSCASCHKAHKK